MCVLPGTFFGAVTSLAANTTVENKLFPTSNTKVALQFPVICKWILG